MTRGPYDFDVITDPVKPRPVPKPTPKPGTEGSQPTQRGGSGK